MADDSKLVIKLLQKLREDMFRELLAVRVDVRDTRSSLDAFTGLARAKFTLLEDALIDLSARTLVLSDQVQRATTRYDAEIAQLEARLTNLEHT